MKRFYNRISGNFPIEKLAIPDFSDLSPTSYALAGKPMTFMITSRSCPHKCSFCSVHTTFGIDYQRRSLENVLEEIELRYIKGIVSSTLKTTTSLTTRAFSRTFAAGSSCASPIVK